MMLDSILSFIQDNSFILGVCISIILWIQTKFRQVTTIKSKMANMEKKFLDMEEKRIYTLEQKLDSLFQKHSDVANIIAGMKERISSIKGGVARIEDILMKR